MLAHRRLRFASRCPSSADIRSSSISSLPSKNNRVPRACNNNSVAEEKREEASTRSSPWSSSQIKRRDALAAAAASFSLVFLRPSLARAETTSTASTSSSATTAPTTPPPSSSRSERFETADFSLTVPAGFGLAEVAKAGYTPTTAEERGARGRGVAAPDSPVKVRFTAPATAAESSSSSSSNGSGSNASGSGSTSNDNKNTNLLGSSELSVIVREAAGIKPTFLMVSDISQWGDAAAVGALLLPRGVTVTRAATERVELPPRDTGSIAGVVASPPQTAYLYEFEDRRGDLFVTLAAVARAGKIYVVAGSARGGAAWEARREGMREAVRSFRVTPALR